MHKHTSHIQTRHTKEHTQTHRYLHTHRETQIRMWHVTLFHIELMHAHTINDVAWSQHNNDIHSHTFAHIREYTHIRAHIHKPHRQQTLQQFKRTNHDIYCPC